jgi:hypothetical protein
MNEIITTNQQDVPAFLDQVNAVMLGMDEKRNDPTYEIVKRTGRVITSFANTEIFLQHFSLGIRYDEFNMEYVIGGAKGLRRLDDVAVRQITRAMEMTGYVNDKVLHHLMTIGDGYTFHPLRVKFDQLQGKWDGTPRLDTMLHRFLRCEDNACTRFISSAFMIAAVRRIRQPGFSFKYCPVLESGQDARKSSFIRALAFEIYACENLELGEDAKVVIEQTKGKLLVELAELSGMGKRDADRVKHFLSRREDQSRMAFERATTLRPRQFICIGTINQSDYAKDETGGVRWWPILCGVSKDDPINIDSLRLELDQLWGEACVREANARRDNVLDGVFYPDDAVSVLLGEAQNERYHGDAVFRQLESVLSKECMDEALKRCGVTGILLTGEEVLQVVHDGALVQGDVTINKLDGRLAKSVATAMLKLGWVREKRRVGSSSLQQRCYVFGKVPAGAVTENFIGQYNKYGRITGQLLTTGGAEKLKLNEEDRRRTKIKQDIAVHDKLVADETGEAVRDRGWSAEYDAVRALENIGVETKH